MAENTLPDLHDWEITGVFVDRYESTVEITFISPERDKFSMLLLEGVTEYYLSNMIMQNVILDVMVFEENKDSVYLQHCYSILGLDEALFELGESNKIIYFEPSVGVEIACNYTRLHYQIIKSG